MPSALAIIQSLFVLNLTIFTPTQALAAPTSLQSDSQRCHPSTFNVVDFKSFSGTPSQPGYLSFRVASQTSWGSAQCSAQQSPVQDTVLCTQSNASSKFYFNYSKEHVLVIVEESGCGRDPSAG